LLVVESNERREEMVTKEKAPAKKKAPARARVQSKGKGTSAGDSFTCEVCGLVVSVDEECGCVDVCDIICCGEPMKPTRKRRAAVKALAKAKAKVKAA
jgi:hypothetical protein